MPSTQEFAIISNIDTFDNRSSNLLNRIVIDDDIFTDIYFMGMERDFSKLVTYSIDRQTKYTNLNLYYMTLIPPESLEYFKFIIEREVVAFENDLFRPLLDMIELAIDLSSWVVHFGV